MTVLGLDCAGKTAGVAVCQDEQLVYESRLCAGFTHSETLLCLCEEALRACRLCVQELSLLAVTAGPGSFTGLRIGLAVAKGLAFPHDIPCAGVSTLESLAFCAPPAGSCVCALDARRGEVYHAAFAMGPQGPRRLWPDGHGPAAALTEQIPRLPRPLWLLGDGAGLVLGALGGSQQDIFLLAEDGRCAGALGVCRAALRVQPQSAQALAPCYLRLSQAERERAEKLARAGL